MNNGRETKTKNKLEKNHENLAKACSIFTDEYDLSIDQNLASLELSIQKGYIDLKNLKEEFRSALNDESFKWNEFAINTKLLTTQPNRYSSNEIKEYVKKLLRTYLDQANL